LSPREVFAVSDRNVALLKNTVTHIITLRRIMSKITAINHIVCVALSRRIQTAVIGDGTRAIPDAHIVQNAPKSLVFIFPAVNAAN
jgi:hypothetical protein